MKERIQASKRGTQYTLPLTWTDAYVSIHSLVVDAMMDVDVARTSWQRLVYFV